MQLRDIQYVITVAEEQSFTKAAHKCYVSESALSQSISKIELEIGSKLFLRRSSKKFVLTETGRIFISEGRHVLEAMDSLKEKVNAVTGVRENCLKIAISPYYEKHYLSKVLPDFQKDNSETTFLISEVMSDEGEQLLLAGKVNLAFIIAPVQNCALRAQHVFSDQLVLIVPRVGGIAEKFSVPIGAPCSMGGLYKLKNEPFIAPRQGRRLRKSIEMICKSAGFDPICAIETGDCSNIAELVRNGCGVGIIPNHVLTPNNRAEVFCYALDTPLSERKLMVCWDDQNVTVTSSSFVKYAVSKSCFSTEEF